MGTMATAVVFEQPGRIRLRSVQLPEPLSTDCVVEVHWTGISTGTERLLLDGRMPHFPGLGYPLVPGYESVGNIVTAGPDAELQPGQKVFIPGSRGFTDVAGLFGGAAKQLVVPAERLVPLPPQIESNGILLALAATACHALRRLENIGPPELIIGHGALGRLLARAAQATHQISPTVWETVSERRTGNEKYAVVDPKEDDHKDYKVICDVSGSATIIDHAIKHATRHATILLAGFYADPIQFGFPAAFMREIDVRISAEWEAEDMDTALDLVCKGDLSLNKIITHDHAFQQAEEAYKTAFSDPSCLKMVLDWRGK